MLEPVQLDPDGFRENFLRRGTPGRVFCFEHDIAAKVKRALMQRFDLDSSSGADHRERAWRDDVALYRFLGMETFHVRLPGGGIPVRPIQDTGWAEEHAGPIQSWEDFERFPWPNPDSVDYAQLEAYERSLPDDMAVYAKVTVWEQVSGLFGFETFCYRLHEEPDLVRAVAERVGEFYTAIARHLCDFRCVFALYGCDDFGYKTATMLRPDVIRELFLPWHRQWAELAHEHGKFYALHSCGRLDEIMGDLIDDVRIDAKQSFEEAITPVDEAKGIWGDRLTLLGGLDVDRIARADERTIRDYTRRILQACVPGGGYCLGLGNWVTEYIPPDHYLWVLDEGRRF